MKTINVHIGRLVLDGLRVEPRQAVHVKAACEQELARLFTDSQSGAWRESSHATSSLQSRPIHVPEHQSPTGLGEQIAGAVHGGVGEQS
jgi:hypothetical protein